MVSQHRLVVMDLRLRTQDQRRRFDERMKSESSGGDLRTKWWRLKDQVVEA